MCVCVIASVQRAAKVACACPHTIRPPNGGVTNVRIAWRWECGCFRYASAARAKAKVQPYVNKLQCCQMVGARELRRKSVVVSTSRCNGSMRRKGSAPVTARTINQQKVIRSTEGKVQNSSARMHASRVMKRNVGGGGGLQAAGMRVQSGKGCWQVV